MDNKLKVNSCEVFLVLYVKYMLQELFFCYSLGFSLKTLNVQQHTQLYLRYDFRVQGVQIMREADCYTSGIRSLSLDME